MNDTDPFAITLHVPDATLHEMRAKGQVQRLLRHGEPDPDFLCPAWWEFAHTVRLGLAHHEQSAR